MKRKKKEKFRLGLGAEFFEMKSRRKKRLHIFKSLKIVHKHNYNARTYTLELDNGSEMHVTASMISIYRKGDKLQIVIVKPFSMLEGLGLAVKNGLGVMHRDNLVLRKTAEHVTINPHNEVNAYYKNSAVNISKVALSKTQEGMEWTSL